MAAGSRSLIHAKVSLHCWLVIGIALAVYCFIQIIQANIEALKQQFLGFDSLVGVCVGL